MAGPQTFHTHHGGKACVFQAGNIIVYILRAREIVLLAGTNCLHPAIPLKVQEIRLNNCTLSPVLRAQLCKWCVSSYTQCVYVLMNYTRCPQEVREGERVCTVFIRTTHFVCMSEPSLLSPPTLPQVAQSPMTKYSVARAHETFILKVLIVIGLRHKQRRCNIESTWKKIWVAGEEGHVNLMWEIRMYGDYCSCQREDFRDSLAVVE